MNGHIALVLRWFAFALVLRRLFKRTIFDERLGLLAAMHRSSFWRSKHYNWNATNPPPNEWAR